jgi:hypothetical protein
MPCADGSVRLSGDPRADNDEHRENCLHRNTVEHQAGHRLPQRAAADRVLSFKSIRQGFVAAAAAAERPQYRLTLRELDYSGVDLDGGVMGLTLCTGDQTRREPPARRQQHTAGQRDQTDPPVVDEQPDHHRRRAGGIEHRRVIKFAPLVPTKTVPLTAIWDT